MEESKRINSITRKINGTKTKPSIFAIIIFAVLLIYAVVIILFLLWGLRASLYPEDFTYYIYKKTSWTPEALFTQWDFSNIIKTFDKLSAQKHYSVGEVKLYDAYLNGILYAGGGAICQTFCTALVAYLTAKYDNAFSRFFHKAVLFTLVLPIAGNIVSQLDLVRSMGLFNNMFGAWIQKFGFTNMYYLIFYAAYRRLSWSYAESAFVDGAGHFRVFARIMFPMSLGLFGTVALLFFVGMWNDYQFPLMFLPDSMTPSVLLYDVMTSYTVNSFPLQCMCAFMVCLPILIVFLIFRKKIMCNLTEGGIKE